MPQYAPQATPQPTDLLMYLTSVVMMLVLIGLALIAFVIYDRFIYPKRARAKRLERIRNEMLDREDTAAERRVAIQADLEEWTRQLWVSFDQRDRDDTIIIPFVDKRYHDGI